MEGNRGTINLNMAFSCQICQKLAFQPFISNCCEAIVCQYCVRQGQGCPKCKKEYAFKSSPLLKHIYPFVTCPCPFGCGAIMTLNQIQKHEMICPEGMSQCPFCKQNQKIRLIPEHLGAFHSQECSRLLLDFNRNNDKANQPPVGAQNKKTIQPFCVGVAGNINIEPRISSVGRLMCGKALIKDNEVFSMNQSNSLFGQKSQVCSVDNGSCQRCMELDVKRLGLPAKHILNALGRICVLTETGKLVCGCSTGADTCSINKQCAPCLKTYQLIKKGFYHKVLGLPPDAFVVNRYL